MEFWSRVKLYSPANSYAILVYCIVRWSCMSEILRLSIKYGLWSSTLPNDLRVSLPSIIITATTDWPQKIQKPTAKWIEIRQSQRTNMTFWPLWAKRFCFLRGPLQWLTGVKSITVGWIMILNFRVRMFLKGIVRLIVSFREVTRFIGGFQ